MQYINLVISGDSKSCCCTHGAQTICMHCKINTQQTINATPKSTLVKSFIQRTLPRPLPLPWPYMDICSTYPLSAKNAISVKFMACSFSFPAFVLNFRRVKSVRSAGKFMLYGAEILIRKLANLAQLRATFRATPCQATPPAALSHVTAQCS